MKKHNINHKRWERFHQVERAVLPALAILSLSVFFPSMKALALDQTWGPERETFTWEQPATYRTFNSITDNPAIGDERNFVRVREVGMETYYDNVEINPGKEYEVYVFFHNNAAARLNASGAGIADNVRLFMDIPEKIEKGQQAVIKGTITSGNTTPTAVWDTAFLYNNTDTVYLRYVPNSATIHNNGGTANGAILDSNALFGETGAYLAYHNAEGYWGVIPGCNEYTGYVTLRVVADHPNFTVNKEVSTDGANVYGESVNTAAGSTLDFKITYKNTGTMIQNNVTVYDVMPKGMEYIAGTTFVVTPTVPNGEFVVDKLFDGGLNIGGFRPGEEATITYKAKLAESEEIFPCGQTEIFNNSSIATNDGTKTDQTRIVVVRNCTNTPPPELPNTGPAEIVLALVIVTGIGIGGVYFIRTRSTLKKLEGDAEGKN